MPAWTASLRLACRRLKTSRWLRRLQILVVVLNFGPGIFAGRPGAPLGKRDTLPLGDELLRGHGTTFPGALIDLDRARRILPLVGPRCHSLGRRTCPGLGFPPTPSAVRAYPVADATGSGLNAGNALRIRHTPCDDLTAQGLCGVLLTRPSAFPLPPSRYPCDPPFLRRIL